MKKTLDERQKNMIIVCVLVIILVLQVLNFLRCYADKEAFGVDEYLTLQYAHYYTSDKSLVTIYKMDWEPDTWIDSDYFKDTLLVGDGQRLTELSFGKAIYKLLSKRTYFGIVNLIGGVSNSHSGYRWGIILFNTFVTIISEILLFVFLYKMLRRKYFSLFAVLMYGFSAAIITLTTYIRFYAWILFLFTCVIFLHYLMWRERETVLKNVLLEMLAFFLLYISMKNSELGIVFGATLLFSFTVLLLCEKRKREALLYAVPLTLGGLIYMNYKTFFLDMLLNPKKYRGGTNKLSNALDNMLDMTLSDFISRCNEIVDIMKRYLYGTRLTMLYFSAFLIALLVVVLVCIKKRRAENPVKLSDNDRFMICISVVYVIYNAAMIASGLMSELRYYSPALLMFVILFAYCTDRVVGAFPDKLRVLYVLAVLLPVIYGNIRTANKADYQFAYEGGSAMTDRAHRYDGSDTILILDSEYHGGNYAYDCVDNLVEGSQVYVMYDDSEVKPDLDGRSDDILIWTHSSNKNIDKWMNNMREMGYNIEDLGKGATASHVYVAHKQ